MNAKARTGGKVAAIVEIPWEIVFLQKALVIEKRFEPLQIGRFGFELRVLSFEFQVGCSAVLIQHEDSAIEGMSMNSLAELIINGKKNTN